jgi:hypothetical protein
VKSAYPTYEAATQGSIGTAYSNNNSTDMDNFKREIQDSVKKQLEKINQDVSENKLEIATLHKTINENATATNYALEEIKKDVDTKVGNMKAEIINNSNDI